MRRLADDRPVLIAIDDSQWLDYASSAGLAYAVRRFRSDRIGLLLSRRSGLESALLDELLRSPLGERFTRVEVGALDVSALGRAIHDRLGTTLARPLLVEVHTAAGGNPFYALEIVRMLQRTGTSIEAGQPVPLPDTLQELVRGRILALPTESRDFLLAAAAHAHPTIAVTEAASGIERGAGLTPALDAHVVELDGDRIRFTHPLLAAGVYEGANPLRRVEVHARLAELLEDPEARAWQLAAYVDEPDASVAAVLEGAAEHARGRGALRAGALLFERAAGLTPAGDELRRTATTRRGCVRSPCRGRHAARTGSARAGTRGHGAGDRPRRPARRVGAVPLVRRRRARRLRVSTCRLWAKLSQGRSSRRTRRRGSAARSSGFVNGWPRRWKRRGARRRLREGSV